MENNGSTWQFNNYIQVLEYRTSISKYLYKSYEYLVRTPVHDVVPKLRTKGMILSSRSTKYRSEHLLFCCRINWMFTVCCWIDGSTTINNDDHNKEGPSYNHNNKNNKRKLDVVEDKRRIALQ
jgi:hypothetical protein